MTIGIEQPVRRRRPAGEVRAAQDDAQELVVVTSGPRPGMTALQLVDGYLRALFGARPDDDTASLFGRLRNDASFAATDG